jgi:fibronectin type 3 domain-containing protein
VGVKAYRIWRNNAVIAETGGTSYIDSSVSVGQTYTYFVTAYDAAGNASAGSNQVAVTVKGGKK